MEDDMPYTTNKGVELENFEDCVVYSHPTGSRYICDPAPKDTDNDTVFLVNGYYDYTTFMLKTGWEDCGIQYNNDVMFRAFRKGEENYILTEDEDFYLSYVKATEGAKALNLLNKKDRIALFKAINTTSIKGRAKTYGDLKVGNWAADYFREAVLIDMPGGIIRVENDRERDQVAEAVEEYLAAEAPVGRVLFARRAVEEDANRAAGVAHQNFRERWARARNAIR